MPEPLINRHLTRIELGRPHTFSLEVQDVHDPPACVEIRYRRGTSTASKDIAWSEPPTLRFHHGLLEITSTPTQIRPPSGVFAPTGLGDGLVTIVISNPPETPGGWPVRDLEPPTIPVVYS